MLTQLPAPPSRNPHHQPNDTAETRLQRTLFIVEATNNEQHEFWRRFSNESRQRFTKRFLKVAELFDKFALDLSKQKRDHIDTCLNEMLEAVKFTGSFSDKPFERWEQVSPGWLVQVGSLNGRPISLDMQWVSIDGFLVCFYSAQSQVVDHKQIDKWLRKHFKGTWDHGTRWAHCDSSNFHHCMDAIQQAKTGPGWNDPLPPQPPRSTDLTPNKYFTPLTDERLLELARAIKPVYRLEPTGELFFVKEPKKLNNEWLRYTAFLFDVKQGKKAVGLKRLKTITTYHSFGYYGIFKPDISEVLAQLSAYPELIEEVVAFEITGAPKDSADLNKHSEALNAGFHVAETTFYTVE
jgi:hypothetical protein